MRIESWISLGGSWKGGREKKTGNVEHEGLGKDFGGLKCVENLCFFAQTAKKCVWRIPHGYVHG